MNNSKYYIHYLFFPEPVASFWKLSVSEKYILMGVLTQGATSASANYPVVHAQVGEFGGEYLSGADGLARSVESLQYVPTMLAANEVRTFTVLGKPQFFHLVVATLSPATPTFTIASAI